MPILRSAAEIYLGWEIVHEVASGARSGVKHLTFRQLERAGTGTDRVLSPEEPQRAQVLRPPQRIQFAGLEFDRHSEADVIQHIIAALDVRSGGWVATPNIDICRQTRWNPPARSLLQSATLVVPDGMPLIWFSRIRDERLTERVTGSSLIFSLTEVAAKQSRSIYLIGGEPGVAERAGQKLAERYPGLKVAGSESPPMGFDETGEQVEAMIDNLQRAAPDIVYVGLGFPKQERLIARLTMALPSTWLIGCGAAIPFAAGALPRAPFWMQRSGLEWLFRLLTEPRRLFRRYLVHDAPYAARLLVSCLADRGRKPRESRVYE